MGWILIGLGALFALAAFVFNILVIVKMFQNDKTGLGIVSVIGTFVCGFGYILTLIFGWQNRQPWSLQKIMPIYTACFVLGVVLYGAGYAIVLPQMLKDLDQDMNSQFESQQEDMGIDFGDIDMGDIDMGEVAPSN